MFINVIRSRYNCYVFCVGPPIISVIRFEVMRYSWGFFIYCGIIRGRSNKVGPEKDRSRWLEKAD